MRSTSGEGRKPPINAIAGRKPFEAVFAQLYWLELMRSVIQ